MRIYDYENRIKEIDDIFCKRSLNTKDYKEVIQELKVIYDETKSIRAEVLYYNMQAMYLYEFDGSCIAVYEAGVNALRCAEKLDDNMHIIQAYNTLGLAHSSMGNVLSAFDCYWTALEVLGDSRDTLIDNAVLAMSNALNNNIGLCLMDSYEFEKAIGYFQRVIDSLDKKTKNPRDLRSRTISSLNIVICYYELGKFGEALELIEIMLVLMAQYPEFSRLRNGFINIKFMILYKQGKKQEAEKMFEEMDESNISGIFTYAAKDILRFFVEEKQYNRYLRFYNFHEESMRKENNTDQLISVYTIHMQYCEEVGNQEEYRKACMELGKVYAVAHKEQMIMKKESLATYIRVAESSKQQREMEKNRELLKYKSEYDELTDLPNRHKLTEFCIYAFEKAKEEQCLLSIEIIDVDFFKQVNDTYGHTHGDFCLKSIADEIKKMVIHPETTLASRYGGDEFVIVRLNESNETIIKSMNKLKTAVYNLGIPNKESAVADVITISQGSVNRIPLLEDDLESYLKQADDGLYKAKKDSKNTSVLINEILK